MKRMPSDTPGLRRTLGTSSPVRQPRTPVLRLARWSVLTIALAGSTACTTFDAGPGSMASKRRVSAARLIASEVDAAVAGNRLQALRESVECDGGSVAKQATLFTDASGNPRKYVLEGQTKDAAHYAFYYYDTAGKLRMVESDQRIGQKSQRTSHLYFDPEGKLVHKDERLSGPRVPFHEASERHDPAADIRSLADPRDGCRRVSRRR
jgi:hypothetical protein